MQITTVNGCTSNIGRTITVEIFPQPVANFIFSPSDPYNYHLTIFDRWGGVLFESYNSTIGWSGTYKNGDLVQDGVYAWEIEFGDINNDKG